jgi:hypothetical protein
MSYPYDTQIRLKHIVGTPLYQVVAAPNLLGAFIQIGSAATV